MADELYDVVFKGELVRTFEVATVKKNLAQLFKMDAAKVEALFSGKTVVLKRKLNFETATKYRVAIKKAGARVDLVEIKAEEKKPEPTSQGKAVFGERAAAQTSEQPPLPQVEEQAPMTDSQVASAPPAPVESNVDTSGISLAPPGTEVLKPNERQAIPEAHVDISGLSVKENAGDLLDESEKQHFEELNIDLSAFDLDAPGADLLKENEKKHVEAPQVNTDQFSVAEPGVILGKPKPPPPPAPDVSNIKLADE